MMKLGRAEEVVAMLTVHMAEWMWKECTVCMAGSGV